MKTALVYSPYFSILGGGEVYSLHFAKALAKHGHSVTLATDIPDLKQKVLDTFNLNISEFILSPSLYQILSGSQNLPQKILTLSKFDTFFFVSDGSIPFCFSKNNIVHFQAPYTNLRPNLITKLKLHNIHHIVTNSKFTKKTVDKQLNLNSTVLYPPVNFNPIKDTLKQDYILSVARFTKSMHNKRQDILINTFKSMVDGGLTNWTLKLVGSSLESKDYLQSLKKLSAGYPIEFHTSVNAKQLPTFYSRAKIFWHSAGYGIDEDLFPEKVEHFGIVTVEAMLSGVIPIVINKGGQKEIVDDLENGYLFDTTDQLAQLTLDLIANYNKIAPKLITNATKKAQQFTQEKFYQNVSKLL